MSEMSSRTYVVFDRASGEIVATSTFHYVDTPPDEPSPAEVLASVGDTPGGRQAEDLDMIVAEDAGDLHAGSRVDLAKRILVPKLQLDVRPERTDLAGDGEDTVQIEITARNAKGRVARDFDGELVVTTTRGRLSERRGRVHAKNGVARIALTSVPETVEQVRVGVRDPSGRCVPGGAVLEFS